MESKTNIQCPRIAIKFCVQCKWNLRAAYYAQELLQTFSDTIGEIALIPVTGGMFTITIYQYKSLDTTEGRESADTDAVTTGSTGKVGVGVDVEEHLIWDRKRDSGFPETKELKNRVRNIIDPEKNMGHVDRALKKGQQEQTTGKETETEEGESTASTSRAGDVGSGHKSHLKATDPPADCEECKEAAKAR